MNQNKPAKAGKSEPEVLTRTFRFTPDDLEKLVAITAQRTIASGGKKKASQQDTLAELIREKFDNTNSTTEPMVNQK